MADAKISALAALAGTDVDTAADVLPIVDTSVTTTKKILIDELAIALRSTQAEVDAGTSPNTLMAPSTRKISLLATQAHGGLAAWDFTIPAGATEIVIEPVGLSTNGSSAFLVQLGDAGGIETSVYRSVALSSGVGTGTSTAGFILNSSTVAAGLYDGQIRLRLVDAATFTWSCSGSNCENSGNTTSTNNGSKSLSAVLTTVRLTTVNGTDVGDAGLIGCSYIL